MPQKRISICTSLSVRSRRAIVVDAKRRCLTGSGVGFGIVHGSKVKRTAKLGYANAPFYMQNAPCFQILTAECHQAEVRSDRRSTVRARNKRDLAAASEIP